jgi:uroporphyrinogen decarboxylase
VNYRELFDEILHYGEYDRMPVIHWTGWQETLDRWHKEGMPEGVDEHEYFNAVPFWTNLNMNGAAVINVDLYPEFAEEVLEETVDYRVFRRTDGVLSKDWKHKSSIPQYLGYTLNTAADWDEYKKRLQPDPGRIAPDIDTKIEEIKKNGLPIAFPGASMMGWIRNWMGVENMSYLIYDDPDVFEDMVMTLADLVCWAMDQVLPKIDVQLVHGWEDICGRQGPLIGPEIFDKYVAAGYRTIRAKMEEYGLDLYSIDSDGDVRDLVGHWLDAGVNVQFPIEIGPFGGDAMELRKKYGRELRIIGNFDKRVLAQGRDAIQKEIDRLMPLMREGGFIIMPDHIIPPDVPLDDYRWYLEKVRELRF